MAKNYPPYMNATGTIPKILDKIKVAATPDRFTQDYLGTELGFPGGSAKAFIPLAKRIGLLGSDGTPSDLYKRFRNTNKNISRSAMAEAIKAGYADIYSRNEYAHSLSRTDLEGLIMEMTGLEKGHATVRAISGSFEALKSYADFETKHAETTKEKKEETIQYPPSGAEESLEEFGLNLSYTINLVLPKTDDIAVFNAIFRSLRENLLRK